MTKLHNYVGQALAWRHQFLAFATILCVNPVMLSRVYGFPGKMLSMVFFVMMLVTLRNYSINRLDAHLVILVIMSVSCAILSVIHTDPILMDNVLQYVAIAVFLLFIIKVVGILSFSDTLVKLLAGLVLLNIFLSVLLSLNIVGFTGSFEIGDHSARTILGLANSVDNVSFGGITYYRMAGVFDEPGQFSYVLWHAVILNRFTLKSRNVEKILVYGGFVTMSLAHFVVYIFYIIFVRHLTVTSASQIKTRVKALLIFLVATFVLYFLFTNSEVYPLFDKLLFSRINLTGSMSDGVFTGTRFSYSGTALSVAFKNPFLGLGLAGSVPVSANIMDIFIAYGFIVGPIIMLPLLCLIFVACNRFTLHLGSALTIFILYIQRPSVGQFITTVIIFIVIYQMNKSNIDFRRQKYGDSL